jgi:hypothetical protein
MEIVGMIRITYKIVLERVGIELRNCKDTAGIQHVVLWLKLLLFCE